MKNTNDHLDQAKAAYITLIGQGIALQALLPNSLLTTSLALQNGRNSLKQSSQNLKMIPRLSLKRNLAQTGQIGKPPWTAKLPRLKKQAHGLPYHDLPTRIS